LVPASARAHNFIVPTVIPVPAIAEIIGLGIPAGIAVGKNILTFPASVGKAGSQLVHGRVSVIVVNPVGQRTGRLTGQVKDGKDPDWSVSIRFDVGNEEPNRFV